MKSYYALRIASWLTFFFPARVGYWLAQLAGGALARRFESRREDWLEEAAAVPA